jgi:hypothetical protein
LGEVDGRLGRAGPSVGDPRDDDRGEGDVVSRLGSWFGRGKSSGTIRAGSSEDLDHLREFIRTHDGVEAFVEPRTAVTDTTVLLVAHDGEWTRRRVGGPQGAASFARSEAIPLYDAEAVGYPSRMRAYNERKRSSGA